MEKQPKQTPHQLITTSPDGSYVTIQKIKPAGSLQFKKQVNGTVFVWRYTINEKGRREIIGFYDSKEPVKSLTPGVKGYSIAAAIKRAEDMAFEHVANLDRGGRPGLEQAKADAAAAVAQEEADAARYTLAGLMYAYVNYLESKDRQATGDVRSIVNLHIVQAFPTIAAKPAKDITEEDVADMQRRLIAAGKGRTSNKLRSYIHAAYKLAKSARSRASVPENFKLFKVDANPAAEASAEPEFNKSDKEQALTTQEMIDYWKIIKDMEGPRGAALRLHLLTGAQRIAQLVRLKTQDINELNGNGETVETVISIFDGKGRPGKPARLHQIPLIPPAQAALKEIQPEGLYAISTAISIPKRPRSVDEKFQKKGDTHVGPTTLSGWAQDAVAKQNAIWAKEGIRNASGEIKQIKNFELKHLRSGVETLLASEGVTDDHRGRLQSHGIAGVQNIHYNNYKYLKEIRNTLLKLYSVLEA